MDGESKVTESNAILKHLCRKRRPELLGKTEEVKQRIDMLEYFMYDIAMLGIGTVAYQYTVGTYRRIFLRTQLVNIFAGQVFFGTINIGGTSQKVGGGG